MTSVGARNGRKATVKISDPRAKRRIVQKRLNMNAIFTVYKLKNDYIPKKCEQPTKEMTFTPFNIF